LHLIRTDNGKEMGACDGIGTEENCCN
jgi:hypothetical protein